MLRIMRNGLLLILNVLLLSFLLGCSELDNLISGSEDNDYSDLLKDRKELLLEFDQRHREELKGVIEDDELTRIKKERESLADLDINDSTQVIDIHDRDIITLLGTFDKVVTMSLVEMVVNGEVIELTGDSDLLRSLVEVAEQGDKEFYLRVDISGEGFPVLVEFEEVIESKPSWFKDYGSSNK